ncbi:putative bifunctional diguanylate cyclase/phosphodiesterase [Halopseudomonas salegens]|uniref:cyclic-guanylate-specific phosphodiesterase n=1 Tax=Halopseudomonas salegens TaxID=1434072 RepID=A0A1H2HVE7_9GAMM|nr:EAL domain-containing protein [Halopseudomonas salegens]SDU35716.1 diguanylate cyclase (GGDEF) domain-containing protein [Halopseudomonas salegens]
MALIRYIPLRYKFWAVNGLAFISTLVLVLVAMGLELRSINDTRQEQGRELLRLWSGAQPLTLSGPLRPILLDDDDPAPWVQQLLAAAQADSTWLDASVAAPGGDTPALGTWVSRDEPGEGRAVIVQAMGYAEVFAKRAPVYAAAVFFLMLAILFGSQALIRFVDRHQRKLQTMAHYDVLTGLPNRLLAHDRLQHALEKIRRRGGYLAVLFIDLDRFKTLNDSHGHSFGDEVLKAVTRRLQVRCRSEDTLARLGGDEFLLILEQLGSAERAEQVANELLELFREALILPDGREVFVGASIGIAVHPGDGLTGDELVRNADAAMYLAKTRGRNGWCRYEPWLTEQAMERFELERNLRRAVERQEFRLHYQPLTTLDGRPFGVEALLRWRSSEHGDVPPDRFIGMAEETGMIVQIGNWVMQEACRQAQTWRKAGIDLQVMAVNLSPIQFLHADVVQQVAQTLRQTGLPARCLELEITEGALMQDTDHAEQALLALRELGVHVVIDDFGTGYSSLAYLRRFALDKLKVDRTFLQGLPDSASDAQLVRTIMQLGQGLGLQVLVEGVETEAQRAWLAAEGCRWCQGFLFARPMSATALAAWWPTDPPTQAIPDWQPQPA